VDADARSLDVKKNQGQVLARTLAMDSGGQCKSLHALVVSPRIGKERLGGLDHQCEPKSSENAEHYHPLNRSQTASRVVPSRIT
jgi:hypothetical protein